jgi:hypothetical protein
MAKRRVMENKPGAGEVLAGSVEDILVSPQKVRVAKGLEGAQSGRH